MTDGQFDQLVTEVWQKLLPVIPSEFRAHFDKIRILIESEPSAEVLEELRETELAVDPHRLCGLHMGVPLPEESLFAPSLFPTRVYLFRHAILDEAEYDGSDESLDDVREEIAITLLHEIGHFFGLDEDDLDRLGFG